VNVIAKPWRPQSLWMPALPGSWGLRGGRRAAALAAVLIAHGIALYLTTQLPTTPIHRSEPPPVFVTFLPAPTVQLAPAPPPAPHPKPIPLHPHPVVPHLLTVQKPAAASPPIVASPPPQAPAAPVDLPPSPEPVAAPSPPAPVVNPPVTPATFLAAYLNNPDPEYPRLSRQLRESGTVRLHVLISPDGRSQQIEISTSSGSDRLDQAAIDAVRKWRFVPAKRGEQAIAAWVLIPIAFHLDD
jgi:protein TonB